MSHNLKKINFQIPKEVLEVIDTLQKSGFEAYLVGGCVRDMLTDKLPKDWDITTSAKPGQIVGLFTKTVYENNFGTVAVIFENVARETLEDVTHETSLATPYQVIEVTPYRLEAKYSDTRHPDSVIFSQNIEDDLKRRDFTVNAMAFNPTNGELIDIYKGQEDIKDKVLRTVGSPDERFGEDALRILRAVRFAVQLDFEIDKDTEKAIVDNSHLLKKISEERIRDEFIKIIMSPDPLRGIKLLSKFHLLTHTVPELEEGIGCEQKGEHIYDVFDHLLHALEHAEKKDWSLHIRLAALFHDIGKPRTRRWDGTKAGGKGKYTFYGHEVIGARMTAKIMDKMRFPKKLSDTVVTLVRNHMFFSDTETITLSAVRRVVANVGESNIWDLMKIRECDRVGMKKVEAPYRLRKYHAMIEEALRSPTSVAMLKIDGARLIEMRETPGPKFSHTLHALLEEVLENPTLNTEDYLESRARELLQLPIEELKKLGEAGKEKKEETESAELKKIHKKHGV
ncbi:MAG: CCA tRNA nucleotidyltransferase [Candidatus Paceibacterota bacterium]|jgi:putative nucleotidyltransferase with HDIG domain